MTPSQVRALCQQALLTNSYPIIAPEIILSLLDSVEGLSLNHPDNTADCQSLALDHLAAISRVGALEAELTVTDKLLAERNKVMEAIPECPEHGSQCVPYALEWIERAKEALCNSQS